MLEANLRDRKIAEPATIREPDRQDVFAGSVSVLDRATLLTHVVRKVAREFAAIPTLEDGAKRLGRESRCWRSIGAALDDALNATDESLDDFLEVTKRLLIGRTSSLEEPLCEVGIVLGGLAKARDERGDST